ncbi:protein phosphatase [Arthrobacter silviterrae]|uniref:Serine/threonine-protein phosphatase n=1 Tax=Arthrobacter silviterrae TaxID=2026658 RepID=A0ABX0D9G5_9MICC|nr:protein phosphatase 2C domain-containing protein [Arthrobacter silviterrae]MDQ0279400.1 protein phosphatase [Arthrobacter silviterrae]NGN82120.1 serine/threonine-protein phosphatase [Arthrobacter silviterrae]
MSPGAGEAAHVAPREQDGAAADSGDSGDSGVRGVRLSFGFGSDRGLRRELNEDSFLAADPIFAVADGMGGHEAGEVASRECISVLSQQQVLSDGSRVATAVDLQQALRQADARIREISNARAGTTVTGVTLVEERGVPYWLVFNVGDSRTYRLSQGTFAQVSVDHSEVQELVDGGYITPGQALVHPRRHVVTRALGTGSDTEADFWLVPVEEGDRILVCSDGLTNEVTDEQIHRALSTLNHPQDAVDSLIQSALRAGGRDNVTVVVVDASNVDGGDAGATLENSSTVSAAEDTLPRMPRVDVAPNVAPDAGPDAAAATDEPSQLTPSNHPAGLADGPEPSSDEGNYGDDHHG